MMRATIIALACVVVLNAIPTSAIELRVERDRLVVTGPMMADDDFELLSVLIANQGQIRIVHFHDIAGGDLPASIRMGRIIRARQLDTIASSYCFSSCAFAFLGGVNRRFAWDEAGTVALLGYHGASHPLKPGDDLAQVQALIGDYLAEMTGQRFDRVLIERTLRLRGYEMFVFVDATRRGEISALTAIECPLSATINQNMHVDRCVPIDGISAWQQGVVTDRNAYRIPASRP